ncbi:MAG: hypothetical protein R3E87_11345 [Burkholderiaceae bacterium]
MNNRHQQKQVRQNRAVSSMGSLVAPDLAVEAAQRLYAKSHHGLRFCCEHREVLSLHEAKLRDEHEAKRRRARPHDDDFDLGERFTENLKRNASVLLIEEEIDDDDAGQDDWDFDAEMIALAEDEIDDLAELEV